MPPKQATSRGGRGQAQTNNSKQSAAGRDDAGSSDPFDSSDDQSEAEADTNTNDDRRRASAAAAGDEEEEEGPEKSIPRDLLTRVLHEFFAKDATRISRDGNAAVAKYMDVFVREAIARAAVERKGGFLEVEDLEKIAPQLLLDL
jgi:centromere protein X